MIEEIWKDIKGYEGLYQVSNIGRVKSLKRHRRGSGKELVCVNEKIKALQDNGHGYMTTTLYQNNKGQVVYIHRLVAVAFISNPNNLPCVNHINEDKSNNSASNLEWCSYEYNNNYGTKPKRLSASNRNHPDTSKAVLQYDLQGNLISEWPSMREIQRRGVARCENVYRACVGIYKQANGFIWRYK